MTTSLFRTLSQTEEASFRAWARNPENYAAGESISPLWHPVIQDECRLINEEMDEAYANKTAS